KGQDIVFGAGQYRPQTQQGRGLIAHELTHTLQQRNATRQESGALEISGPDDASEREADAATKAVMEGRRVSATTGSGMQIAGQREPDAGAASTPDAGAADAGGGPAPASPPDAGPAPDGGAPGGPAPAPGPAPGPAPVAAPVVTNITVANQAA